MKNKCMNCADFAHTKCGLKSLQVKNYELFEIISKLKSYAQRPNKNYLKPFYQAAIFIINFIIKHEFV